MYIPKRYGQSKIDKCPFCEKRATTQNKQGFTVCEKHRTAVMDDLKCVCGNSLEILNGKFGVFFRCIRCGTMNLRKVLEVNQVKDISGNTTPKFNVQKKTGTISKKANSPRETEWIRSDDPRYFD